MVDCGGVLPSYVQREFENYLKCGRLEYGFLRVRCETCHAEMLVAFQSQATWLLSELWCPAYGRVCGAACRHGTPMRASKIRTYMDAPVESRRALLVARMLRPVEN